jgi:hypothetical protein
MMSSIRGAVRRVLHFVVRLAPSRSRSWGEAMLREMDYVDDDWAALLWALGSTLALGRHFLSEQLRNWRERSAREALSQRSPPRIVSALFGVAAAAMVLTISMLTLTTLRRTLWVEPDQARLVPLLFAVVIPDAVCLVGAVALWRPQSRIGSGILAAVAALGAHSIIYFVA